MAQRIKLKRQSQTGITATGLKPHVISLVPGELAINTVDGTLWTRRTPTGNPVDDVVHQIGGDPFPSQVGQASKYLMSNGSTVEWGTPDAANATAIYITQNGHTFVLGDVVYHTGTNYALARADDVNTADVVGIVTSINASAGFTLTLNGLINFEGTTTDPNWIAGQTYYLSPDVAGAVTPVEPTEAGHVNKPLIVAISGQRAFFYNWRGILNDIPEPDIDNLLPPQDINTVGMALLSGSDGNAYWGGGAGGGASSTINVNQSSHGFIVGKLVRYDGTVGIQRYVLASADTAQNADVVGIVSSVATPDLFTITTQGMINNLSGLTPGTSYFLSSTTAGNYQQTPPVEPTSINKPVLMAVSTTSALFSNWRGISQSVLAVTPEVAPQTGNSGRYLTTNGVTTAWGTPVTSFNTRTGAVTLSSNDVVTALGYTPANINSPVFTGNPTAPTPAAGDNDTSIATTAFVQTAIQTAGRNSQGTKTLSTSAPTGTGNAGDIWYQY